MKYKIKSVRSREELKRRIFAFAIFLLLFASFALSDNFSDNTEIPEEWLGTYQKASNGKPFLNYFVIYLRYALINPSISPSITA